MRKLLATALLLGFTAMLCGMHGCPAGIRGGTGTLTVMITDKPYPYDLIASAELTITEVQVRSASEDDEDENGFITIFEGEKVFDLIDLQNGRTDLLADAEIDAGLYDQTRLIVTEGLVVLVDGTEFPLSVPSGAQSGIKLHFDFEVVADENTQLLLDVDLSRLFRAIPSGKIDDPSTIREFTFHPSVAMRLINLLEAGSISGLVTDEAAVAIEGAAVTAFLDGEEVTSTSTEPDGTYMLVGLVTGTYDVEFSAAGFQDASVTGVEVMAGEETTDVNAVLVAEEPPPPEPGE